MILALLRVIEEANDLIEKDKVDRGVITEIYQDLSSIGHMIEDTLDSDSISTTN